ncbi:flagellar basal body rod protein FlgB [Maricurvus nonylphenolicus]|uniref:flagellar basal body rod protein FlgB n=1 Tax=Maricurvus nonylphenolicus TaxID=1008307 RepID=UPI0036F21C14
MSINFENALGIHEQALQVRAQRAEVLANNLTNVDTPNYKARDIDFRKVLSDSMDMGEGSLAMNTTNGRHQLSEGFGGDGDAMYRVPNQPSIDGNTVEEHVEHAEYMRNSLQFQASFTFLNSKFKGLMNAIRGE